MIYSIFKYTIDQPGVNNIEMPKGSKPLSVYIQKGVPQLWALVDAEKAQDKDFETRRIVVRATGQAFVGTDNLGEFIGTFITMDGMLVFHVFDLGPK